MLSDASACLPGDFEPQSALVLGFNELLPIFPQLMVDLVSILIDRIPLIGIVDSEEQRRSVLALLCDWGLPAHLLHFVSLPVKGMWVRDYGPSFVRRKDGSIVILDAEYLEAERRADDRAPADLAALLRVPVVPVPLTIEGGNLLSNGRGICITTETTFRRNAHRNMSRQQVQDMLRQFYGFEELVVIKPLRSERTGHVDMFATFAAPDVIVVGQYDPGIDPVNADLLDENASVLSKVMTKAGPLRVVRIPMPLNHGNLWRTYTNVIYANGTLLMPNYAGVDPEREQAAKKVYSQILPGWDIRGVECGRLIRNLGALRCISLQIPWLDHLFDRPPRQRDRETMLGGMAEYRWP